MILSTHSFIISNSNGRIVDTGKMDETGYSEYLLIPLNPQMHHLCGNGQKMRKLKAECIDNYSICASAAPAAARLYRVAKP
jgi:hypothetical protein